MHVGHRELVKCLKECGSPGEVTMQRCAADADGRGDLVLGRLGPPAEEGRSGAQHMFTIQLHETSLSHMRRFCFTPTTTPTTTTTTASGHPCCLWRTAAEVIP